MMLQSSARIVLVALMLVGAFVAGQRYPSSVAAQSRQKWEYRIINSFHAADQMNQLGEEGWEAVTLNDNNRILMRRSK